MNEERKEELTRTEEYLLRLLHFKSLDELTRFLNAPEDPEALTKMEPPYDLYEEITKAEEESQMVEDLERLYLLSQEPR